MGLRLDMTASVFLAAIITTSIVLRQFSSVNSSTLGLVLSQSIQLLTFLQWTTRQSAEVEVLLI